MRPKTAQSPKQPATAQQAAPSLLPTTTEQQDMTTAGQRRVNIIWESTQAVIAIVVVVTNVTVGSLRALGYGPAPGDTTPYPDWLSNALFLVVGFYFSRTNHTAIGGTGPKPEQLYVGR